MKKSIYLSFFSLLMISFVTLQSCKSTKENTNENYKLGQMSPNKMPNINGSWSLKYLNNQEGTEIFPAGTPTINIDLDNNHISGFAGCNRYTGQFTLSAGILSAPNLASTRMMCMHENQESQFLALLAQTNKVSLNEGNLIFKQGNKVVAEFTPAIDQALLEGRWILTSIQGQDMNTLFPMAENIPSLTFDNQEGRIAGNAGCNNYGANYEISERTVTIGMIMATKMACPNLQGEGTFTNLLTGVSKIEVNDTQLSFYKDEKLTLRFQKAQ